MRRSTGWRAGLVGVIALAAATPAAIAADDPSSNAKGCAAPTGLVVNRWVGQTAAGEVGLWTQNSNWSLGKAPGRRATKQVVCIRSAARVVIPVGADLRVHVAAVDIDGTVDGPAEVVVLRSNGLYVEAAPQLVKSHVAGGSQLRVKGGALGGAGLILAEGEVVLNAEKGWTNVLSTRACGAFPAPGSCATPPSTAERVGTLQVSGGGRLRINNGLTLVTDGYDVRVAGGQLFMSGEGGRVSADAGTSLTLLPARRVAGQPVRPVLVFENDGGWYAGDNPFALIGTRVSLNGATVRKASGTGTSTIGGEVTTKEVVRADIQTGSLSVALATVKVKATLTPDTAYSTGTCSVPGSPEYDCAPAATPMDTAIASVGLPESAAATQLSITEKDSAAGATGTAIVVDMPALDVSRSDPAVLTLRYDASVVGARTPLTARIAVHSMGSYRDLGDCTTSGTIPEGFGRCVDRRAGHSFVDTDGDLVMEVHTQHFSRFICR